MVSKNQDSRTVIANYQALVKRGEIKEDPAQLPIVEAYDQLLEQLNAEYAQGSVGFFRKIFRAKPTSSCGLYIYGQVGRGKTMLMDLFYQQILTPQKKRVHFNDFMTDVHSRIAQHRQDLKNKKVKENDPIPPVARDLVTQAKIICFDEFTVTDIADAMVLSRLFTQLFAHGVILIATSNVAPDDLYKDGLNRALFVPFIDLLKQNVKCLNLDADKDYRQEKIGQGTVYFWPLSNENQHRIESIWRKMCEDAEVKSEVIMVRGHALRVPAVSKRQARFSFADLCETPLAAADYLALVAHYDSFVIDSVPQMNDSGRNIAKRFILLVDTLYDHHKKLVMTAASSPAELYHGQFTVESFEFERTASRLLEMQSIEYLQKWEEKFYKKR